MRIIRKESPLALYKGLGAVTAGIVPKMAIRFTTFQFYKDLMVDKDGTPWKLNNLWGRSSLFHFINSFSGPQTTITQELKLQDWTWEGTNNGRKETTCVSVYRGVGWVVG